MAQEGCETGIVDLFAVVSSLPATGSSAQVTCTGFFFVLGFPLLPW
jgi:hypothetical protein